MRNHDSKIFFHFHFINFHKSLFFIPGALKYASEYTKNKANINNYLVHRFYFKRIRQELNNKNFGWACSSILYTQWADIVKGRSLSFYPGKSIILCNILFILVLSC